MYQQCELKRGSEELITWLDTKKLRIGSVISLVEEDKSLSEPWTVYDMYEVEKTKEDIQKMARIWRDHRKGTDI